MEEPRSAKVFFSQISGIRQSRIYQKIMDPYLNRDIPKPFDVYDYKQHRVEECPELVKYVKKLEKSGLKDPFVRNYVWRYHPCNHYFPTSQLARFRVIVTKGMIPGLFIALGFIAYGKLKAVPEKEGAHH